MLKIYEIKPVHNWELLKLIVPIKPKRQREMLIEVVLKTSPRAGYICKF